MQGKGCFSKKITKNISVILCNIFMILFDKYYIKLYNKDISLGRIGTK